MRTADEHFDLLFTTDCLYSRPIISNDSIRICVRELGLMEGHPLRASPGRNLEYLRRCHFIFRGVTSSKRSVTPYIGDPKIGVLGPEHREDDGPFEGRTNTREYAFEGRFQDPAAWVDWVVEAEAFMLEAE